MEERKESLKARLGNQKKRVKVNDNNRQCKEREWNRSAQDTEGRERGLK